MKNLIVVSDIKRYKQIYSALSVDAEADTYIDEAQTLDVRPWLGDALILELSNQRETSTLTPENTLLMNGGSYTFDYDQVGYHKGLIAVLAYYAYAKVSFRGSVKATQFGLVQKNSDNSDPVSDKTKSSIKQEIEAIAEAYKQDVILFLHRKASDYPLYKRYESAPFERRTPIIKTLGE